MLYRYLTKIKNDDNLYKNNCNKQNSLLIPIHINEYQAKERPNTAQYVYNRRKTIKSHKGSFYNSVSMTKKPTSTTTIRTIQTPSSSQIYMKLDQRDKIEKIIKEESKKIHFIKKINNVHHLSSEELKRRLINKVPQNSYKRVLKRKLKESIKSKTTNTFLQKNKKEIKHIKKLDFNNNIINLIKANKKLIRNVGSFSTGKEMSYCKKNLNIVNNYFHKAAKQKERMSIIMTKKTDLNKKKSFTGFNYDNLHKNNNKLNVINNEKYKKFRNKLLLRNKNKLKEKSRVFDNIIIDQLNTNLEKIRSIKDDTYNTNKINYVSLTNKILLTNLVKQMKIIYIKDPDMNFLRGNEINKISDLRKEIPLFDEFEELSKKYNDDHIFSRYQKIKLSLPKFIKTKFKNKTNYFDNYFGVPV